MDIIAKSETHNTIGKTPGARVYRPGRHFQALRAEAIVPASLNYSLKASVKQTDRLEFRDKQELCSCPETPKLSACAETASIPPPPQVKA
jgi:hypothetical protein